MGTSGPGPPPSHTLSPSHHTLLLGVLGVSTGPLPSTKRNVLGAGSPEPIRCVHRASFVVQPGCFGEGQGSLSDTLRLGRHPMNWRERLLSKGQPPCSEPSSHPRLRFFISHTNLHSQSGGVRYLARSRGCQILTLWTFKRTKLYALAV